MLSDDEYQSARRGRYGTIMDGHEVLSDTPPSKPHWRYDENYILEVRIPKKK